MAERTNDQIWEQLLEAVFQEHYYLLRGEGSTLGIADKVNELMPNKLFDTGSVFVSLDRLERPFGHFTNRPSG
jgi:hypothetical protein